MAVARSIVRATRLPALRPRLLPQLRTHATALEPSPSPLPRSDRAFEASYDPVDVGPVSKEATDTAQPEFGGRLDTLAVGRAGERREWLREEVQELYDSPLMELVFRAATVHRANHDPSKVQLCTLLNIKEGGCTEDCSYCAQSSRHSTGLKASKLIDIEPVLAEARKAKANGSTRFCMGAAWRDLHGRKNGFKRILEMVKGVRGMGMEVCTTLGMLSADQARQLKEAGLTAYNHNLDTSREYYPKVITTRSYDERLSTIENVRQAGISVCSGGIIGLGEEKEDRVGLVWEMTRLPEPPESFPVNALVPIPGTPLGERERVTFHEILRTIATARIALPTSIIRFAAGRNTFSEAEQAMCYMAGANAIFTGERMLTTPTSGWDEDHAMFSRWGIKGLSSFEGTALAEHEARQAAKEEERMAEVLGKKGEEEVSRWAREVGVGEINVSSTSTPASAKEAAA